MPATPSGHAAPVSTESLAERALLDPAKDVLGYRPFAKDLARALRKINPSDGLVVALHGSWGAGKSTMLNFVTHYLTVLSATQDEAEQTTVVRFNPWWFSGQDELVRIFFEELLSKLTNPSLSEQAIAASKPLAAGLRILGKAFSKLSPAFLEPLSPAGAIGEGITQLGEELGKLGVKTLSEAKEKVEQQLKVVSTRILVIIDDIDRLAADEIKQIFRLVKSIANFPNITYLLAFDRQVVTAALRTDSGSGEDYLAKIVQITFELPPLDQTSLRYLLEQRLRSLLAGTKAELFAPGDWSRAYVDRYEGSTGDGIRHFLRTPRDVIRFTNHLSLTYRIVENKVNAVDFIIIETFRIFCSAVYHFVRSNPDAFCFGESPTSAPELRPSGGPPGSTGRAAPPPSRPPGFRGPPGSGPPISKRLKEIYEPMLRKFVEDKIISADDVEPINRLMKRMFPSVGYMLRNEELDAVGLGGMAPVPFKGISDAEFFPRYFRLSPPDSEVSLGAAILALKGIETFRQDLRELSEKRAHRDPTGWGWAERPDPADRTVRTEKLLDRLSQNIHEIPEELAGQAFQAVFDNLQAMPTGTLPGDLLGRVPEGQQRLELLKEIVDSTNNLQDVVSLVAMVGSWHREAQTGATPPPQRFSFGFGDRQFLDRESQTKLESLAAGKIQEAAASGTIWEVPNYGPCSAIGTRGEITRNSKGGEKQPWRRMTVLRDFWTDSSNRASTRDHLAVHRSPHTCVRHG